MVVAFHDIARIVSLFSNTMDSLWVDDGVEYKSVVIGVHDDVTACLQEAVSYIASSSDDILITCATGNLHSAASICALHMMNEREPSAVTSEAWLRGHRSTITIQDDIDLWKAVQLYEGIVGRPIPHDSPESPGKKMRQEVMENIDELSLGSPKVSSS